MADEKENEKPPRIPRTLIERSEGRRVIIVLHNASLETVKTKRGYQLLNCDDHRGIILKMGKEPTEYRPDIVHQALMSCLDSPLNKAGLMQVFIHTNKNVLIEVNPAVRIPRTFKRFCGLMGNFFFSLLFSPFLFALQLQGYTLS